MFGARLFRLVRDQRLSIPLIRCLHPEFTKPELTKHTSDGRHKAEHKKVFSDEESTEILDVEEARTRFQKQTEAVPLDEGRNQDDDEYYGLNLKRGVHGVFDVEDLVELLRKEHVDDIFVCYVPEELKYVDHLVVCSARSYRHMLATAEFVRRMFKIKRIKGDILPRIEGEKSRDWMAMDLGNIALHIFSPKVREEYDLESLWAIGSQYDHESQKPQNPYGNIFLAQNSVLDVPPAKNDSN